MECVDWGKNAPILCCGKVRTGWCRNDERSLAFDLDVVITKFKSPSSQFAVPCHKNGFDFALPQFFLSMRKCGRDVLELFHGGADGLQYKQEGEGVGIPALLLHVAIKRLNAI